MISGDGTQHECSVCPGDDDDCKWCEGTGWMSPRLGYSCLWSAQDLVSYLREWAPEMFADPVVASKAGEVIVFTGRLVGRGDHEEPLVVPTDVVERMSWSALLASAS